MGKYPIHEDFKKYANMQFNINRFLLPISNFYLELVFRSIRSDSLVNISVEKIPDDRGIKIRLMLYEPVGHTEKLPCLIYFHGGGFMLKSAKYRYDIAHSYCLFTPCKLLFVDYGTTPENPFPVAAEEGYTVLKWAMEISEYLRIDADNIAVAGDSAGGNLAASVAMMARDRIGKRLSFQMLIYPALDRRMKTESMRKYTDTPVWNSELTRKMWDLYLADKSITDYRYASPMEAESLINLPDTYIETAEFDCLHDEALEYAERLKGDGVSVELNETRGTMHGYDIVPDSEIVRQSINMRIDFMRKTFNKNSKYKCNDYDSTLTK